MVMSKSLKILISTVVATALVAGCSKKNDDDDEESSTAVSGSGGSGSGGSGSNALADAVPSSLALAVFPQSVDSASLALQSEEVEDPNKDKSVKEKVAENKERLSGNVSECLNIKVFKPRNAMSKLTCYEFDSGMNPFQLNDKTFGSKSGLDDSGKESCMVAFARNEIAETVERVDQAMELISGMVCQAQKDGTDVALTVGGSVDLAATLATATKGMMPVTVAKITRLADDADGSPVYHSRVEFALPDGRTSSLNLVNSTSAAGSKGTLSFQRAGVRPDQAMQNDPNNDAAKHDLMSINYSRGSDDEGNPRMRFEARFARMVKTIEPFDTAGLVNFAALPENAANSDVHAIKFIAFDMNPDTNEGALSYWMNPGGSYGESARGFLFNIEKGDDSVLKGCGISGATNMLSIRKAVIEPSDANVLKPVRDWQPQWAENTHADKDARFTGGETSVVTEQCFKQNTTTGDYEIDRTVTNQSETYGYDVKTVAQVLVAPPTRPDRKFEGEVPKN